MSRTAPIAVLAALLAAACAHPGVSTTTVTGGSPSRARGVSAPTAKDAVAMRLADEICAREAACNHVGDGARYRSEEACLSDQGARAPAQLSRWACTPGQTDAGLEQCLAAIRSERCETDLARTDLLVACRSVPICGR